MSVPLGLLDPFIFGVSNSAVQQIYQDFPLSCARYGAGSGGGTAWQQTDFTNSQAKVALLTPYTASQRLLVNIMAKKDACFDPPQYPNGVGDCSEANYIAWLHDVLAALPDVTAFQIHNEPQTAAFWKQTTNQGGKAGYAHLVQTTATVIRADRPDALIVLAGMDPGYCDDVLTIIDALPGGIGPGLYDVADYHMFGTAEPDPVGNQVTYDTHRNRLANYRTILDAHKPGCPLWITENATYSDSVWTPDGSGITYGPPYRGVGPNLLPSQSEEVQAQNLVKRLLMPLALGVQMTLWAQLQNTVGFSDNVDNGYFDFTGLLRLDGTPKAAYYTLQRLCGLLSQCDATTAQFLTPVDRSAQVVSLTTLTGDTAYCAWEDQWKTPLSGSVTVPISGRVAQITTLVQRGAMFAETSVPVNGGVAHVPVGADPVWIQGAVGYSSPLGPEWGAQVLSGLYAMDSPKAAPGGY